MSGMRVGRCGAAARSRAVDRGLSRADHDADSFQCGGRSVLWVRAAPAGTPSRAERRRPGPGAACDRHGGVVAQDGRYAPRQDLHPVCHLGPIGHPGRTRSGDGPPGIQIGAAYQALKAELAAQAVISPDETAGGSDRRLRGCGPSRLPASPCTPSAKDVASTTPSPCCPPTSKACSAGTDGRRTSSSPKRHINPVSLIFCDVARR